MTSLTRRSFLAAAGSAVVSPAVAAPAPAGDTEVVIVGAGAAGIAAARRLAAANRRFVLVEASDRVGGRCITDTSTFGVPFDLGAHSIYSPDTNPVAKVAGGGKLDIYRAPTGQRVRIGRRNARESEMEDFLTALVKANRAIGDASRSKTDMHAAQVLPRDLGDWKPAIDFMLGPYTCAADLNEVSAMDLGRAAERDTAAFCRQGLGTLLTSLAAGIPVRLDTAVTQIDTRNTRGRAEVRTTKGMLSGRYVIVTAPAAVLAADKISFLPELPKRQRDALAMLKPGSLDHVALEMPDNPLGLQRDDLVFEKAAGRPTAALLANVSATPLAVVTVGGQHGRELAAGGEKTLVGFATDWLAGLYGADIRKAIRRTRATNWNAAPWIMGAMATAGPGGQPSRRALTEPIRDRLYFAGEATHETQWGTVGGAWESGERAAEAILRRMGVLKEPVERKPERAPRRRQRNPT